MTKQAVSVVIPTYNRPQQLTRAVRSVVEQTYENWELIVVNDHPTVDVRDVLPDDDRIQYLHHSRNQGAPAARNNGIESSRGQFVAFLDDDDAWKPQKLERQMETFETLDESYGLVFTGREKIRDGESVHRYEPEYDGFLVDTLLERNIIPSETPLIRRECFDQVGVFDPSFPSLQDLDFWVRIGQKYRMKSIPELLAYSHVGHSDRISVDMERKYLGHKQFVAKHFDLFSSNAAALAKHRRLMGVYAAMAGEGLEGCRSLISAYRYNPRELPILLEIGMSLSPSPARNFLYGVRERVANGELA